MEDKIFKVKLNQIEEDKVPANVNVSGQESIEGEWKMTVEEFSFAGCHYNSSCD